MSERVVVERLLDLGDENYRLRAAMIAATLSLSSDDVDEAARILIEALDV